MLLGLGAVLPARPQRVLVAGTSGAGKTTVARHVALALSVPHVEIDGLFHGPGWSRCPTFERSANQRLSLGAASPSRATAPRPSRSSQADARRAASRRWPSSRAVAARSRTFAVPTPANTSA